VVEYGGVEYYQQRPVLGVRHEIQGVKT
jgi:hypothetical protein